MINDPNPLKYMGTQSLETVNMAAAMARGAALATEQAPAQTADYLAANAAQANSGVADKISDAASWAADKATAAAQAAADRVRKRTTKAVATYTRQDPIRAILIAAGTGALLMGVIVAMSLSGVRSVRRKVQGRRA